MSTSTIQINDKPVEVRISNQAHAALALRSTPITTEMELFFSCLIRKRVCFYENNKGILVTDGLKVDFHPVMTRHCADTELGEDGPPMTDFPIIKPKPFTPRWLSIDFKKGQWQGGFAY